MPLNQLNVPAAENLAIILAGDELTYIRLGSYLTISPLRVLNRALDPPVPSVTGKLLMGLSVKLSQ